jgi:hypothetical protein
MDILFKLKQNINPVTTIKVAPLWAILFFIMMVLLGLDTMVKLA